MTRCSCAGQTCSCSIINGSGTLVTGTGTAADPFRVNVDPGSLGLGAAIQVADSATIDLSKVGTGAVGDPLVITARVLMRSPSGLKFSLQVDDSGVLSTVSAS